MKKNYLKPEIFSLNVFCDAIIAQSNGGTDTDIPEIEGGEGLSNRHRGEWGNVWGK